MRVQVQRLEKQNFVQRGDVTGEFGRSTYGRAFEKLVWACIRRRSAAGRVGIIEKRETVCDWLKATCRDFKTKKYWKKKFWQLLEISRAEHTILGIIWPVEGEAVYFNRTQRLFCYYCEIQFAFVVLALYFRTDQAIETGGNGSVAVISALLMLPASALIPWMFAAAQSFRSRSVDEMIQHHKELKREMQHTKTQRIVPINRDTVVEVPAADPSPAMLSANPAQTSSDSSVKEKSDVYSGDAARGVSAESANSSPDMVSGSPAQTSSHSAAEGENAPINTGAARDVPAESADPSPEIMSGGPVQSSSHSSADTPADQASNSRGVVVSAVSGKNRNCRTKAKQVFHYFDRHRSGKLGSVTSYSSMIVRFNLVLT